MQLSGASAGFSACCDLCRCLQDFDGVIGMFSGSDIPDTVSTDTGLINLQFTSDGTVQVMVVCGHCTKQQLLHCPQVLA